MKKMNQTLVNAQVNLNGRWFPMTGQVMGSFLVWDTDYMHGETGPGMWRLA